MLKVISRCALPAVVAFAIVLAAPGIASAHEERAVGHYHFVVGWGAEPAYAGEQNSVQLVLTDARGKPVTDLGDTLKATVIFGSSTKEMALETTFDPNSGEGTPGDYRAFFIPTRPGDYTFHFTGRIHGQNVDQRFTSSDTTFDAVIDPQSVEFPTPDPNNAQLSSKIDREAARLTKKVGSAPSRSSLALGIAIGSFVIGLAAIGISIGRRKPA
ncbi:MAG: hypothetical protein ABR552_00235 [Actinomycetota bacterium]